MQTQASRRASMAAPSASPLPAPRPQSYCAPRFSPSAEPSYSRRVSTPVKFPDSRSRPVSLPYGAPPIATKEREYFSDNEMLAVATTPAAIPKGVSNSALQFLRPRALTELVARRFSVSDSGPQYNAVPQQAPQSTTTFRPRSSTLRTTYNPPIKLAARSLQIIMPGMYVAFADSALGENGASSGEPEELKTLDGHDYTHIIELYVPHSYMGSSTMESIRYSTDQKTRVQRLHLSLPLPPPPEVDSLINLSTGDSPPMESVKLEEEVVDPRHYQLTTSQLLAARDFLRASGYKISSTEYSHVRLLVTTPRGYQADAVSVLTLFLAFASGRSVEEVVRWHDHQKGALGVWKGVVSDECVDDLQSLVDI